MDKILGLRFQDRDKVFEEKLNSIKNDHSARGMLYSENTVKRGHVALVAELAGSRTTIVTAISESLAINRSSIVDKELINSGIELLRTRKDFLESFYLEKLKPVSAMFQNQQMIEAYTNLSEAIEPNELDLEVELSQEISNFLNSQGQPIYQRLVNLVLGRPLFAIGVFVLALVATALAALA